ncbi:hypothetical protein J2847_005897 [Azospirillum agricola]|uniref:hypothetical protein n=1 Tax=Azospirillum agricola TaxID=1720247 RepID=UPI001AE67C5F|nr:hypothetical protein [Azospirillum agricola]MBP2232568.1 hypothetical protein [Azospirillum agricola]
MHVKHTDPGAYRFRILDAETGEQVKHALEADDAAGWYTAHKVGPDGRLIRTADGDSYVVERIERAIRIETT